MPTIFYEADIGFDAILSYEWLAMYDFVVNPNRHALMKKIQQTGDLIVIPGKRVSRLEVASTTRVDTPNVVPTKMTRPEKRVARRTPIPRAPKIRRALDLFSGTGSVAKALQEKGFEVVTVDFNPRNKPSITVDIAVWQYWKVFQPQYFDVIACCPPCTEFSRAMTSRPRDFARADRMVKTSLESIDYLQPDFWFLENPRHGELRDREYMRDIPYIDVDYCQFSDWGYQKPTRIWGSPMLKKTGKQTV